MNIEWQNKKLEKLAYDATAKTKWSNEIVEAFREMINYIGFADNRLDLYSMKSYRLEKLKGNRKHQHSMRINKQFRLIVEFRKDGKLEIVSIVDIEDYH